MNLVCPDTSIIIRHLVDNDPKFNQLITKHQLLIPLPIIFETVFVLEKIYSVPREEIISNLTAIVSSSHVKTEKSLISQIFKIYQSRTSLSVIDCFLLAFSQQNNATLETYDQKLKQSTSNQL